MGVRLRARIVDRIRKKRPYEGNPSRSYGSPGVLELQEIDKSKAKGGEVLE